METNLQGKIAAEGGQNEGTTWNKSRVDATLDTLVHKCRQGEIRGELRPWTLIGELGGEFAKFYHAGFKRNQRPQWAEQRFPNGFVDLVTELNRRLEECGAGCLVNTKREVIPYRHIGREPSVALNILRELHARGDLDQTTALQLFESDTGITLSPDQIRRYFPKPNTPASSTEVESLEAKRSTLSKQIDLFRKELNLDMSNEACLRGLVFEGFIGFFLSHRYGQDDVQSQVRYELPYSDLNGTPHHSLYLDYRVPSIGKVFEVKLRNNASNILSSVLSQTAALEKKGEHTSPVTVIYRHPCPHMLAAIDLNVTLEKEAEVMGLSRYAFTGRPIRELVEYLSVHDFLAKDPSGAAFIGRLERLEHALEGADVPTLKRCAHHLAYIARGETQALERFDIMLQSLSEPLSEGTEHRIFKSNGPITSTDDESTEKRLRIILGERAKSLDGLLRDLHRECFGQEVQAVDKEVLDRLSALPDEHFRNGLLEVLASREASWRARMDRARQNSQRDLGKELVQSFDEMYARKLEQKAHAFKTISSFDTKPILEALYRLERWDQLGKEVMQNQHNVAQEAARLIKRFYPTKKISNLLLLCESAVLHNAIADLLDSVHTTVVNAAAKLPLCRHEALKSLGEVSPLDFSKMRSLIEEGKRHIADETNKLKTLPSAQALIRAHGATQRNHGNFSKTARMATRYHAMAFDPALHIAKYTALERFVDFLERVETVSPISASQGIAKIVDTLLMRRPQKTIDVATEFTKALKDKMYVLSKMHVALAVSGRTLKSTPNLADRNAQSRLVAELLAPVFLSKETVMVQTTASPLNRAESTTSVVSSFNQMFKRLGESEVDVRSLIILLIDNLDEVRVETTMMGRAIPAYLTDISHTSPTAFTIPRSWFERPEGELGPQLFSAFHRSGLLLEHLAVDFYGRKLEQALVLSHLSEDTARNFLLAHNLPDDLDTSDYEIYCAEILEIKEKNDELFKTLLQRG
jgi:hypothetical protein